MISEKTLLNVTTITDCGSVAPIQMSHLQLSSCKNASIKHALQYYKSTPVIGIIEKLYSHVNKKYRHILVDVKLHNLSKNEVPCIPGWHVDGGPSVESEYVLCTAGSSLTEFYTKQFYMNFDGNVRKFCGDLDRHIGDNYSLKMSDWQVFKYNNTVPHRGAKAHIDGPRLLVRVMGSDKILPQSIGSWQPAQYKSKQ
jgi:hypothetical protein